MNTMSRDDERSPWLTVPDVKALLEVVLAPVVGLVGAVTGFYYGGKSNE